MFFSKKNIKLKKTFKGLQNIYFVSNKLLKHSILLPFSRYYNNEEIKSYDLHTIYNHVENKYNVYTLNSIKDFIKYSKRIEKRKNDIFLTRRVYNIIFCQITLNSKPLIIDY